MAFRWSGVGSEPCGRPPTSIPEYGLLLAEYRTTPLSVRPGPLFLQTTSPPPLCVSSAVKGAATALSSRSRVATRSALDSRYTMEMGRDAAGLCTSAAPRPSCGTKAARCARREDVGRRRGRAVHEVAREPRRDGPDGSARAGKRVEHLFVTTAPERSGERGAREHACNVRRYVAGMSSAWRELAGRRSVYEGSSRGVPCRASCRSAERGGRTAAQPNARAAGDGCGGRPHETAAEPRGKACEERAAWSGARAAHHIRL